MRLERARAAAAASCGRRRLAHERFVRRLHALEVFGVAAADATTTDGAQGWGVRTAVTSPKQWTDFATGAVVEFLINPWLGARQPPAPAPASAMHGQR